jgi:hypothetical protein
MSLAHALTGLLTARTAAVPVALCRIALGIAAFGRSLKTARDLYLLQHDPTVVPARLFDWAPRIDTLPEIVLVGGLGLVASVLLTVGYRASLQAAILAGSIAFLHVVDQSFWAHHMYFLALMLMLLSLTESDAALSVRAWRGLGAADVVAWPVLLMKIQLSLVYFFTGVAKLNPLFLSGYIVSSRSMIPPALNYPTVALVLAGAAVGSELFLAFALWFRPLRPWGFLTGLVLHGLVPVLFGFYAGLVVFSVATLGLYVLFLDARDVAGLSRIVPGLGMLFGPFSPRGGEGRRA